MPLRAVETPLLVEVAVIGTLALAASASASALASSARARSSAIWYSRGSISTRTVPASTAWLSATGTRSTVPPMRAATGVTWASTCASSVDSCPRVR